MFNICLRSYLKKFKWVFFFFDKFIRRHLNYLSSSQLKVEIILYQMGITLSYLQVEAFPPNYGLSDWVSKVLLEQSYTHLFLYYPWLLRCYNFTVKL